MPVGGADGDRHDPMNMPSAPAPRITFLYHFLHPDDVVSARLLDGMAAASAAAGWRVQARPCNRGCRDPRATYPGHGRHQGVDYRRVWRPAFPQGSTLGRLMNSAWMLAAWAGVGLPSDEGRPDVVVVGTDPVLGVLAALPIRRLHPSVRIVHIAHDLYPEAAIADGVLREDSSAVRTLRGLLAAAYRACDLIVDLGGCMRARLDRYGHGADRLTLPPWALWEPDLPPPPDPAVRAAMFGGARLGLLYSGNFGRAHDADDLLALAARMRGDPVAFRFAVRGHRADELHAAVGPADANVGFAGFVAEDRLAGQLAAADVHMVSLRREWSGAVVPSKFFGCLAAGRPVVFSGPDDSAIAGWIRDHGVGWVLNPGSLDAVAADLRSLADRPDRLAEMQSRCHRVYQAEFSRRRVLEQWDRALTELLTKPRR
jgi:glycosyltransferase involved in cell wall biosynthesis